MSKATMAIGAVVLVAVGFSAGVLLTRRGTSVRGGAGERKVLFYRDPMNPQLTSPTPKKSSDGMDYVPVYEGESGLSAGDGGEKRGIWIDPRVSQNSGVQVQEVRTTRMSRVVRTVGQITYDERLLFNLNAKFTGWVDKLYVDYTGKRVRKGDPLMEIYSPELVSTEADYLTALRNRNGTRSSGGAEASAAADELVRSARQRLLLFDVPAHEIDELARRGTPARTLMIHSPATGFVIEKAVIQGAQVLPGAPLFKVADLSNVWVIADVYQYELEWVKPGMAAEVTLSYLPGKRFTGKVTYVYPYLATETRTVKARVEVRHPPGEVVLKPDMFATVEIKAPVARDAVVVPEQAIIHTGVRNVAIMALGDGYFEPRDVKLGVAAGGLVEVLEGISPGERIVTTSQFLIDAEANLRSAAAAMSRPNATPMSPPAADGEHAGHGSPAPAGAAGMQMDGMQMEGTKRP